MQKLYILLIGEMYILVEKLYIVVEKLQILCGGKFCLSRKNDMYELWMDVTSDQEA